jgi:hypothetical protein
LSCAISKPSVFAILAMLAVTFALALVIFASTASAQGNAFEEECPTGTSFFFEAEVQDFPFEFSSLAEDGATTVSGIILEHSIDFTTDPPTKVASIVIKSGQDVENVDVNANEGLFESTSAQEINHVTFCVDGDDGGEDNGTTPAGDQYTKKAPPGNVGNPKDVVPGTEAKKVPNTGGPPIIAIGALALLGAALIAGRGVLRR